MMEFSFNHLQLDIKNDNELNAYILQVLDKEELSEHYLDEIRLEFLEVYDSIEFIRNLTSKNRGYAKDKKRWDRPYSRNRKEDPNGRIEVDITNPHILEDFDFFRQPAITFQKTGRYTHLYPNSNPYGEYVQFWQEEARRCREGLIRESDGEWIPGYFYFYLNYSVIQKVKKNKN